MSVSSMDLKVKKIYIPNQDYEEVTTVDPGSADVIVLAESGSKYVASFFSYDDIEEKRRQNKRNGEYLDGLYFWDKNMVIVEECSPKTIQKVVQHLIDEGEFQEAFKLL